MADELDSGSLDTSSVTETDKIGGEAPQTAANAALEALGMSPDDDGSGAKAEPITEVIGKTAEKSPEKAADKPPEAKPHDGKALTEEDLARPENLSHKARDRFEKLVGGYKAEKTRADTLEAEANDLRGNIQALQELGFNDQAAGNDLVQFAQFRKAINANPQQAIQMLEQMSRQIEMKHGLRVNASALDGHEDLIAKVNEGMDYNYALEVAKSRAMQQAQQQQNQQYQYQQQQATQQSQSQNASISRIEQMESTWRATNPDYAAIHPHIHAEMQSIAQQFPAHLWPQQVELLYKSISRAMASTAKPTGNMPQPLRGNGHAASRPAPKSASEAALLALGMEV